jgi:hypothetical protein
MIDLWVEQVPGGRAFAHEWANERVSSLRGGDRQSSSVSISHHRDWLAVGLSTGEALGVDVLTVPADADFVTDTALVLSRDEIALVQSSALDQHGLVFAECWTRKEAYAKLRGTGLTSNLPELTLTPAPDDSSVAFWTARIGDAFVAVATLGPETPIVQLRGQVRDRAERILERPPP